MKTVSELIHQEAFTEEDVRLVAVEERRHFGFLWYLYVQWLISKSNR